MISSGASGTSYGPCSAIGTVWMTTVPFVIDQGLSHKYLPKRLVEVAEKAWPEERRHRFFRLLCAMGFAIASFQAFDHVNTELKKVRAQVGYIAGPLFRRRKAPRYETDGAVFPLITWQFFALSHPVRIWLKAFMTLRKALIGLPRARASIFRIVE